MNTLYPGLPDYTGPAHGLACWVHHAQPIEYCTNFAERIEYIRALKPAHEQAVRLAALTCLPLDRLTPTLAQACTAYAQACTAHNQAWTAYDQARTACNQALTSYAQAWTSYDQAWTAYAQAWTSYAQACTAYDQACTAYNQARTAYAPILLALMAELVSAHLWQDGQLVFPHPTTEAQP